MYLFFSSLSITDLYGPQTGHNQTTSLHENTTWKWNRDFIACGTYSPLCYAWRLSLLYVKNNLNTVPIFQLPASDAGSTRSLGSALSSRSYGSGNLNRQYTDVGTSGHYSPHDSSSGYRSKPLDRSLSYVSLNSGSVGNLKDRFDRPSSSRDRYSSLERLNSRDGDYGGKASGQVRIFVCVTWRDIMSERAQCGVTM